MSRCSCALFSSFPLLLEAANVESRFLIDFFFPTFCLPLRGIFSLPKASFLFIFTSTHTHSRRNSISHSQKNLFTCLCKVRTHTLPQGQVFTFELCFRFSVSDFFRTLFCFLALLTGSSVFPFCCFLWKRPFLTSKCLIIAFGST